MRPHRRSRSPAAAASKATATAALNSSGVVTGITVTNAGTGYISAPTVAIANNFPILENNTAPVTINLSNITAGPGDSMQSVTVVATSSEPAVIPNPAVTYTNPSTTGSLTFTPTANVSGVVTITVTVMDNGGNANGGSDTVTETFYVTITPVNLPPTFTVASPPAILESSTPAQQMVPVTGISVGQGDTATASATINNGAVSAITITNGGIGYTSASVPTVTIQSPPMGGTQATAIAVVNSNGVVTGITITDPGSGYTSAPTVRIDDGETLTVTATSNNLVLIPSPTFSFTDPHDTTGVLTYTPAANTFGNTATITVTFMNSGGTATYKARTPSRRCSRWPSRRSTSRPRSP